MLEEHCCTIDASITTVKGKLFYNLVVLERRVFKITASLAAENMGK